jgi:hypothetical protein
MGSHAQGFPKPVVPRQIKPCHDCVENLLISFLQDSVVNVRYPVAERLDISHIGVMLSVVQTVRTVGRHFDLEIRVILRGE